LEAVLYLEDHAVLVVRRVDRRHPPAAVGAEQELLDLLRRDPEGRGPVAVDRHLHLRILDLEVARDVAQLLQVAHALLEQRRRAVQLVRVRALERELVETLRELAADADGGRHLM